MNTQLEVLNTYSVEISGWNANANFFVESTKLSWTQEDKTVHLQHPVRKGAVVFMRLIGVDAQEGSVPVAYQAVEITYRMQQRCYEVSLTQMVPRTHSELPAGTLLRQENGNGLSRI